MTVRLVLLHTELAAERRRIHRVEASVRGLAELVVDVKCTQKNYVRLLGELLDALEMKGVVVRTSVLRAAFNAAAAEAEKQKNAANSAGVTRRHRFGQPEEDLPF